MVTEEKQKPLEAEIGASSFKINIRNPPSRPCRNRASEAAWLTAYQTAYFGPLVWYPPRDMEADKPYSNGQKTHLHPLTRRYHGRVGLDVRRGPGRHRRLRRHPVPGGPLRPGRGRAGPGLRGEAHAPVADRRRRHRRGASCRLSL